MEEEFDNFIEDKVCIYETIISRGLTYEEHNYVSIKDEHIDDTTGVIQETELTSDCRNDKVCVDESGIIGRYIKQEPWSMKDKQGNIHNCVDIKEENTDDLTVVTQQTKYMMECTDDKVCVYDTIISRGYIKDEPYDTRDESGNIRDDININDTNTVDFIVVQETEVMAKPEVNYFICCEECGEEYHLYCLNCQVLFRIFDSNDPNGEDDMVKWTLPKNFLDIRETPSGAGVIALRIIPKGVVFGPFKGLDSIKDDTVSKWKIRNKELVPAKDHGWMNWMQYIRTAELSSHQNLVPFQYEDGLYYRSECRINVGDELLVLWDSDNVETKIEDTEHDYWERPVYERLDDSYACTLCCVGYKSMNHLIAHNCVCCEKRSKHGFGEEIVQCDICKIYLDKKEYAEYHMDACYNSNERCGFKICYETNRQRPLSCHVDRKQINCERDDIELWNTRLFLRYKKETPDDKTGSFSKCKHRTRCHYTFSKHLVRARDGLKLKRNIGDKRFACTLCPYKTTTKACLKLHVAVHNDDRPFACALCPYKALTNSKLKQHIFVHNGDKPFTCTLCSYKATTNSILKQHIASHNGDKPFACALCPFKTTTNWKLKQHVSVHSDDRPFACTLCPFKARKKSYLKGHNAIHNGDKPFACALCPYKTTINSKLKQHVASHNDHKPFACTLCPHKAATKGNLKQHIATHNGDKPFTCSICSYKTKTKACLKLHIPLHNDDRPFACTLCPYKAMTNWKLKQHIAVHNDDRPFVCTLCPYKAKTETNLKRHVAVHNSDKQRAPSVRKKRRQSRS